MGLVILLVIGIFAIIFIRLLPALGGVGILDRLFVKVVYVEDGTSWRQAARDAKQKKGRSIWLVLAIGLTFGCIAASIAALVLL